MIGEKEFTAGLTRIGIAVQQPADRVTISVYRDVMAERTDAKEWTAFVDWALGCGRWKWFPKLAEIQDALREFRGDRPMLAEATEAYERVLEAGTYTAEAGTVWDFRSIRERCGEAAAEAFLAAGGNAAFSNTFRESDRRERFVSAYGEAVRESPAAKLLPAGPTLALPPAEAPPSREEAAQVVERLRDLAGVDPPAPKADRVVVTDERLAELRRQADAIAEP